jgi:hypothetical protein
VRLVVEQLVHEQLVLHKLGLVQLVVELEQHVLGLVVDYIIRTSFGIIFEVMHFHTRSSSYCIVRIDPRILRYCVLRYV